MSLTRILLLIAPILSNYAPLSATEMRGMWVYEANTIAASDAESAALFAFCEKRQITDLFCQVHFSKPDEATRVLENAEPLRRFLRMAHGRSLRIHALFGDPSHTRRAKHPVVLACTESLLAFNRSGSDNDAFDGIHLDIEPHGLASWKTATLEDKSELLMQFIEVHDLVAKRLRIEDVKPVFGTDIVFWLDKTGDDGSPVFPVSFGGVTLDPVRHLLSMVDQVAIMSYRKEVEERNGIIPLVSQTIAAADASQAKVFVGVKMADIGPKLESFHGQTESQMMKALAPVDETFRPHRSYAGLAFFMYEAFKSMEP